LDSATLKRASLVAALLAGGLARADGFDGQRFVPAIGAAGGLNVERPTVPQHLGFGVGLFMNYGYDAVVDRDRPAGVTRHVLQHGFTLDFMGSIGFGDIFELAVGLPVDAVWMGTATNFNGQALATNAGVGDIRVVPKMAWWFGKANLYGSIGFMVPFYFPSGDDNALRGSGGVVIDPVLLGGIAGRRWDFAFNLGFKARTDGKNPDFTGGLELHWGIAGTFGLFRGKKVGLDLVVEWVGGFQPRALGPGTIKVPMEADAALVVKPTREWSIYFGGAGGLDNGLAVPDGRAILGVRYAHRVPGEDRFADSDHDGIINGKDRCPNEPEDFDGFEDSDGCPEPDNDNDGVLDDNDECPDQAGPKSNDGCPLHGKVVWRHGRLLIFGKVHFETGSARIEKRSYPLVEQIAIVIKEHPEVGRVRVEGHTDNVGPAEMNVKLSRERADAVREALVQRGVHRDRLSTQGYGEAHPVAPNRTKAGRAKNRRVEFVANQ
jgi:outer membrane protein OmpA-like peptidoglycan-associated protein